MMCDDVMCFQFASKINSILSLPLPACTLARVLGPVLAGQPELTEELMSQSDSAKVVQLVLFQRLAPLLLLRVLNKEVYEVRGLLCEFALNVSMYECKNV